MNEYLREPYRLFFPIGILFGLWGALLWAAYAAGFTQSYPGALHAQVMIGGFLGSFATGFLMTAVPKFTQTFPAYKHEIAWVAAPLFVLPVLALFNSPSLILASLLISLLGLVKFGGYRFFKRRSLPPPSFVFLGVGLGSALIGLLLLLASHVSLIGLSWNNLGRLLYLQCFMLSLVIGVGSRLVPALLGWGPLPTHSRNEYRKPAPIGPGLRNPFILLGVVFLLSYIVEAHWVPEVGRSLRALIVTFIAYRYWILHKFPYSKTKLSWGLWASCWFTLLGAWGSAVFSAYSVHFLHVTLVGGLSLMTLMVATRVVFAHGGFSLALESRTKALWFVSGSLAMAAIVRVIAVFTGTQYLNLLSLAALLWMAGLRGWMFAVGLKVIHQATHIENC